MDEKQIEKIMRGLDCTREQAIQVIEDDKRIDRGEKLFELPPELEKGAKKARQADRKPTIYNFDTAKKTRKVDSDKANLIAIIAESLEQLDITPIVTNAEREMEIVYNERKFKIVLSAPRK